MQTGLHVVRIKKWMEWEMINGELKTNSPGMGEL
jgi:hypothetical protein